MTYVLIHHTGCSSSKKGLELLRENGVEPEIRKYMNKTQRLTEEELREIASKMGGGPRAFLRSRDAARAELSDEASDAEVFAAMADNPRLIERPIGINGAKAIVGRPNARLLTIL